MLVERFVRAVVEDGVEVAAILTITFTEKAAAELRERIRGRLRELGAERSRASHRGRFHLDHPRLLRADPAHPRARRRPRSRVQPCSTSRDAERLADAAFDAALEELAQDEPGGIDLIAAYGTRAAARSDHSGCIASSGRGASCSRRCRRSGRRRTCDGLREELRRGRARRCPASSAQIPDPAVRVTQALDRLERCTGDRWPLAEPWPGELERVALPRGNGAALSTPGVPALHRGAAAFPRGVRAPPRAADPPAAPAAAAELRRRVQPAQAGVFRAGLRGSGAAGPGDCWRATASCASATASGLPTSWSTSSRTRTSCSSS